MMVVEFAVEPIDVLASGVWPGTGVTRPLATEKADCGKGFRIFRPLLTISSGCNTVWV